MPDLLKELGPGLWLADDYRTTLGSRSPIRMTLLDLGGVGLLHSPIPITNQLRESVDSQLPVRFIVAPNRWHHLYVSDWATAYPDAELYAAPGLPGKRRDISFTAELSGEVPPLWAGHLDYMVFSAMPVFNEVVFFHPVSQTLLVTDLVFNFREADWGIVGLYVRAAGAYRRFGPSRVTRMLVRDRSAGRQQIDRILSWPFERIVMSHGDIVDSGARERFTEAFAWL